MNQVDQSRPFWPSSPSNGFVSLDPLVGIWVGEISRKILREVGKCSG